jgi:hypothetical protein
MDNDWKQLIKADWAQRHSYMERKRSEYADLAARSNSSQLTVEDSLSLAGLTEEIYGADRALPLYQSLVDSDQTMHACFSFGRLLLKKKDLSGQAYIERVMEKMPSSRFDGCSAIADYYYSIGDTESARLWYNKTQDESDIAAIASQERSQFLINDTLLPHGLTSSRVNAVISHLASLTVPVKRISCRKKFQFIPTCLAISWLYARL